MFDNLSRQRAQRLAVNAIWLIGGSTVRQIWIGKGLTDSRQFAVIREVLITYEAPRPRLAPQAVGFGEPFRTTSKSEVRQLMNQAEAKTSACLRWCPGFPAFSSQTPASCSLSQIRHPDPKPMGWQRHPD